MGRHAAGDGTAVDPIVAAALDQRPAAAAPGPPRHAEGSRQALRATGSEGGLGWPGDPADGTGLGWPAEQLAAAPAAVTLVPDAGPGEAPARRRAGWRRLFGGGSTTGSSSAA
ncbi:hypothetical protein FHX36_003731 [Modestobacter versicolor]|uniref:Uncharacterized protein n=1 Tax=Modestobacter versicolor TaxID=429133 RepID=A0A839Y994_9ACTN|nr:hypothetical protein [Modestobacter versicolor]MBB3677996.1 hypothetical protein [Modestobacter versicolor]